ncbi:hypothetical protein GTO89_05490 [Heliobacterium gestii]|uniref:RelA/SpoT domain-containing protein n=1 Tax=Heliomicrobium gestii TaxID=2699 RepID=A0A845LG84_HELGE|nr:hypothetical protein [Heliomicrobium gestii]MBM7866181.1 ppGpp synthetase/RelA/SpoT-type nucleotidyltransferase [Heliomicrobium gestii]MZP42493.1 hypothetical protein [Heliomicrobium gestii]
MELTLAELDNMLATYRQMEVELRVKLESLRAPLEAKYGRPVILFIESRTKKAKSLIEKARRYGWPVNSEISSRIKDIAGLRVIVQHLDDIERVVSILKNRRDLRLINEKDFVRSSKPSGYRSHHLIVEYEMYTPDGAVTLFAEIQVRTVGQHFWAVLQHSMMYKYGLEVPDHIAENLRLIAEETNKADEKMMVMRQAVSKDLETDQIRAYARHLAGILQRMEAPMAKIPPDPAHHFETLTVLELSFQLGRRGMHPQSLRPQELARCSCCKAPFLLHEEVRAILPRMDHVQPISDPVRLCNVCYSLVLPILRWELAPVKERVRQQREPEEAGHLNRKFQQFYGDKIQTPLLTRLQKASILLGEHLTVCPANLNVGAVTLLKAKLGDGSSVQVASDWDPQNAELENLSFYFKVNYRVIGKLTVTYRYPEIEWDEFHEPELVEPESFGYNEVELERIFTQIDSTLREMHGALRTGVGG